MTIETVAGASSNLQNELIGRLKMVVPEAFADGLLDIEKLKVLIGSAVETGPERYTFTWAGRRDAAAMLQAPTSATLVPSQAQSIDFANALHTFVEGENLEVLKTLYRSYFGRVKMIYIDPPYNTGGDFIYPDNFADPLEHYLRLTGQKTEEGNYTTSQPEKNGRLHSAWLTMIHPRLSIARQFLSENGVIFVSIDGKELANLVLLMNEVFGEENQVGIVVWKGATDNNPTQIAIEHEYVLCYAKSKGGLASVWSNKTDVVKDLILQRYDELKRELKGDIAGIQTELRRFINANKEQLVPLTHYSRVDEDGVYTGSRKVHNPHPGGYEYDVPHRDTGKPCERPVNGYRYPPETMRDLLARGKILFGEDETQIVQIKEYLHEYAAKFSGVISLDSRSGSNEVKALFKSEKIFDNPKPTAFLKELFSFVLQPGDLALDFFAGSGSTAHAIIDMNRQDGGHRRSISVQLPEPVPASSAAAAQGFRSIADVSAERIRRVIARQQPGDGTTGALPEGLRVFKLAPSNVRRWTGLAEKNADAYAAQLDAFADTLVEGWKPENVIWEVALREGYSLTARIETVTAGGGACWRVTDGERDQQFIICLAHKLTMEAVSALGLGKDELFVCRDTALDDTVSANLALQCRLKVL